MAIVKTTALCCTYWLKKMFYFLVSCIVKPFLNADFFFFPSSLFHFSENKNLKCSEAILHLFQYHVLPIIVWDSFCTAPDQSLPIPVIPCRRTPCPARATEPGDDTVLLLEEMPAQGTGNTHDTPRRATCPSHWRLRPQVFFQAKSIYSFERSIWLSFFGSSTEVLVVVWELLLHLSHGLDFERVPGILMSQFLGTRNVKKLESVCMCEASLKFVRLNEKSPPYLKKNSFGFCHPYVHRRFFSCLISTSACPIFMLERKSSRDYREVVFTASLRRLQ